MTAIKLLICWLFLWPVKSESTWNTFEGYEYYIDYTQVNSYAEAVAGCSAKSATLAYVKTPAVQAFLVEKVVALAEYPRSFYIGLRRNLSITSSGRHDQFQWGDGSLLTSGDSQQWHTVAHGGNEPSNQANEDCVTMGTLYTFDKFLRWRDVLCTFASRYICQRAIEAATATTRIITPNADTSIKPITNASTTSNPESSQPLSETEMDSSDTSSTSSVWKTDTHSTHHVAWSETERTEFESVHLTDPTTIQEVDLETVQSSTIMSNQADVLKLETTIESDPSKEETKSHTDDAITTEPGIYTKTTESAMNSERPETVTSTKTTESAKTETETKNSPTPKEPISTTTAFKATAEQTMMGLEKSTSNQFTKHASEKATSSAPEQVATNLNNSTRDSEEKTTILAPHRVAQHAVALFITGAFIIAALSLVTLVWLKFRRRKKIKCRKPDAGLNVEMNAVTKSPDEAKLILTAGNTETQQRPLMAIGSVDRAAATQENPLFEESTFEENVTDRHCSDSESAGKSTDQNDLGETSDSDQSQDNETVNRPAAPTQEPVYATVKKSL